MMSMLLSMSFLTCHSRFTNRDIVLLSALNYMSLNYFPALFSDSIFSCLINKKRTFVNKK